jgi:hypothetical protein
MCYRSAHGNAVMDGEGVETLLPGSRRFPPRAPMLELLRAGEQECPPSPHLELDEDLLQALPRPVALASPHWITLSNIIIMSMSTSSSSSSSFPRLARQAPHPRKQETVPRLSLTSVWLAAERACSSASSSSCCKVGMDRSRPERVSPRAQRATAGEDDDDDTRS